MNCRAILRLLPLHVGGDLFDDRALEVEQHLSTCLSCASEFAGFEQSRQSLFALKGEPTPPAPDLWPAVRLQIGLRPVRRIPWSFRAAAALLLVAGGGLAVAFLSAPGGVPEPRVTATDTGNTAPPAVAADEGEFLLAEVGPVPDETTGSVANFPAMTPVDPERLGWDDF